MKKKILFAALLLLPVFSTGVFAENAASSVTVQGSGRVTVTPDLGTISFAVTDEGQEAADVQKAITEQANDVKDALKDAGLPEEKFSTGGIHLYARYDYSSDVEEIAGYHGQISMSVNEISVDEIGDYLQILSENGVNQIDGISVFYSGYEEAYNEALTKAMLQARQKAETIAWAENAVLSGQFTVTEGYQDVSLRGTQKDVTGNYALAASEEMDLAAGSGLDFSVGTSEVEAVVTVCFEINTAEN